MGAFNGFELDGVELSGDRLLLRPWSSADAPDVHAIMQDRSMHRFLALPDPYTPEEATTFTTVVGQEGRSDGTGLGCAVVERSTGALVGAAALRLRGDPEIGYWIAPAAQGNNYAAEATRLLCAWGFDTLGVPRIRLDCDVANLASVRTALAAGFSFEGVARDGAAGVGGDGDGRADLARFGRLRGDRGLPVPTAFPGLPPEGLTDGVVALRPIEPGDTDGLLGCDDEVTVGWGFTGHGLDRDECRRRAAHGGLDWLVGRSAPMAIVDVRTGQFAGELTLRREGPPQTGGIGYTVRPQFRGRGYTARALRLLVPWAFDVAGFARLGLGAKVANIASRRAAESAGFEHEGITRSYLRNPDGTFSDEVRYSLVNPRYR